MKWIKQGLLFFTIGCVLSVVGMFILLRPTISVEEEFKYRVDHEDGLEYETLIDSIADEEVLNLGVTNFTYKELKEAQRTWGFTKLAMQELVLEVQLLPLLRQLVAKPNQRLLNDLTVLDQQTSIAIFLQQFEEKFLGTHPNISFKSIFYNSEKIGSIYENTPSGKVLNILEKEMTNTIQEYKPTLKKRLNSLCGSNYKLTLSENKYQFQVQLPKLYNPEELDNALTTVGELRFEELYRAVELYGYNSAGPLINLNDSLKRRTGDTSETSLGPLFELMRTGYMSTENDPFEAYVKKEDKDSVLRLLSSTVAAHFLPKGISFLYSNKPNEMQDGELRWRLLAIKPSRFDLTQRHVEEAFPTSNPSGFGYAVSLSLDRRGARAWSKMTEQNIGRSIAVVLDGEVYSAPQVNEKIPNGNTSISGNFTVAEATALADLFRGPLTHTLNLRLTEQRVVTAARYAGWGYLILSGALMGLVIGALLMVVVTGGRYIWQLIVSGYRNS